VERKAHGPGVVGENAGVTRKRVLYRRVELTGVFRENRKVSGSPPE